MGILSRLFKPDVAALRRKGDLKGLVAALDHPDVAVRWEAVEALNIERPLMWSEFVVGLLGVPGSIDYLRRRLLNVERAAGSRTIVLLLWQAEQAQPGAVRPLLPALVDGLIAVLRDEDERERRVDGNRSFAARLLGASGDAAALQPLVKELRDSTHDYFAASCAEALGELGDARAIEPLLARLRRELELFQRGSSMPKETAKGLSGIRDPRAAKALADALRTPTLIERGSSGALESALVRLGELAVEPLLELLSAPDPEVRGRAADTLGEIRNPRAVELLAGLLADEAGCGFRSDDPTVGMRAAYALQRIGEPARAALEAAVSSGSEAVRRRAQRALERLGQ
jgi:HEAT repeat protein